MFNITPEDINLKKYTNLDNFKFAIQTAQKAAIYKKQYFTINYEFLDNVDQIKVKSETVDRFNKSIIQCPRFADIVFEEENNEKRGLPSVLITPEGKTTVAVRNLCDSCIWNEIRKNTGECYGKQYNKFGIIL